MKLERFVEAAWVQPVSQVWKAGVFKAGMSSDPPTVVDEPAGALPKKMMSVGMVTAFRLPEPVFHSPKAMVLLVPSWMDAIPIGLPLI